MSEQQDVIAEFDDAEVLAGVRWAYLSATTRSLETYSEADGHDAAWLGYTRFTLFRNRLDRVFACESFVVHSGLDLLYVELSERDVNTMPRLESGLVRRSNLNGSPGWAHGEVRFPLASCVFGKLDRLPWPQKSPTKQRVARSATLSRLSLRCSRASRRRRSVDWRSPWRPHRISTSKPTSSLTASTSSAKQAELVLGRARLNSGGGPAWHWRQDLLGTPPADGRRRTDDAPLPTGPNTVPDVLVRLRRPAEERRDDRASGER